MPRKKSGTFDNKAYQNEYHKAMKTKLISFNPNDPEDMAIWNHLMQKGHGKVTPYMKQLFRRAMILEPQLYPPTRYSEELYGCPLCKREVTPDMDVCNYCGVKLDWSK